MTLIVIFFLSFFAFSLGISAPTALDTNNLLQNAQQLNAELGNRKIGGAVMICMSLSHLSLAFCNVVYLYS